ncbi:DUF5050 domain-containing protein, partial [Neobacillus sp. 179-J 1A1 HS]|uniref:DUF5050 domain-containing protein n=1 Tax=Neobacillus driksii TaxID=3035913 RepID=UPI0035BBBCC7
GIGWFTVRNPSKNSGTSTSTFIQNSEGKWEGTLIIPENAESGDWFIESLGIKDKTGNYLQLDQAELQDYNVTKGFTVEGVSNYDTTNPTLHNIEFSKSTVKAGESIKVYITATDDNSGIEGIGWFTVRNPSKNSGTSTSTFIQNSEGKWEGTLIIPENAESGDWFIESLGIKDKTGNYLQLDQAELQDYNVTKGFTVEGVSNYDTTNPTLHNIEFSKSTVKAGESIKVYITATDENSGIEGIGWFTVRNPSRNSGTSTSNFILNSDGKWEGTLAIPENAESGEWVIESLGIKDKVGNYLQLNQTDLQGYNISKGFTIEENNSMKIEGLEVTTDKTGPQKVGTPITITATSTGSASPLYKFWYRENNGEWTVLKDYGLENSYTWIPDSNGNFLFSVQAKDISSKLNYDTYKSFYYNISDKLESVEVTTDKTGPQKVGTPITITATSTGSASPLYKFWYREKNGEWKVLKDYGIESSYTWTPGLNGNYLFSVQAKDINSKLNYDTYKSFYFNISDMIEKVEVTTDKTGPQKVGTPITITATSTGSARPLYKFWYREKNGEWKVLKDYGMENSYTWTPDLNGNYLFSVQAKDINSKLNYDTYKSFYYNVSDIVEKVEVTTDKAGPQKVGTPITITATSTGSASPLYRFWYRENNGEWKVLKDYSMENSYTWTPDINGNYLFSVQVKDVNSKLSYDTYKSFYYQIVSVDFIQERGNRIGNSQINQVGDWVYYSNIADYGRLYKMNVDGTQNSLLSSGMNISNINVIDDWIYYSQENNLYRMKTDGSQQTLMDTGINHLNLVGGSLYYFKNGRYLMKSKLDGSERNKIMDILLPNSMVVDGDWIYLTTDYSLNKLKTDGSNFSTIVNDRVVSFDIEGEWIYYSTHINVPSIAKIKTNGSEKTLIKEMVFANSIYKVNNSIFFKTHDFETGTDYLSELKLDTLNLMNLIEEVELINITEDAIYYKEKNLNYWKKYELYI